MAGQKTRTDKDPRNVKVKALRPHRNEHGDKFAKAAGDEYVHPRPAGDIAGGVVELADGKAARKPRAPRKPKAAAKTKRASSAKAPAKTKAAAPKGDGSKPTE